MLIIQATTISGKIINGARWEVTSLSTFQKGQKISVELITEDLKLVSYLNKSSNMDCMVDEEKHAKSVVVSCIISDVRHMVHVLNKTLDTMVIIVPVNRLVEHVLQYVFDVNECDKRFVGLLKGGMNTESS